MSYENYEQSADNDLGVVTHSSKSENSAVGESNGDSEITSTKTKGKTATSLKKPRKRSNSKVKHVFNNRNMLNSQIQKASLNELKSASEVLIEVIKIREEEERLVKEKLDKDRAAAAKLLEQAKEGGIDPAVLAEVFAG